MSLKNYHIYGTSPFLNEKQVNTHLVLLTNNVTYSLKVRVQFTVQMRVVIIYAQKND